MGRTFLLLLALALIGCAEGYDGHREDLDAVHQDIWLSYQEAIQQSDDPAERTRLVYADVRFQDAAKRLDSLFQVGPRIRYYSDSLAQEDSIVFAGIVRRTLSAIYNQRDTTLAVFTYLEHQPWMQVLGIQSQADEARMHASVSGEALEITQSPNMARLSYQAFERAKRLALASEDPRLYNLADSSYRAVARQVMTMPDSVRAAFGPAPERPARIPWVLATLAAAFIAASVAGSWGRASQSIW